MKKGFLNSCAFLMSLMMIVACGNDDDDFNNDFDGLATIVLTSDDKTENGYFDGSLYYTIIENASKEVAVTKVDEDAVNVDIPAYVKIEGSTYKCTTIGIVAFGRNKKLISVSIPNTITSIEESAFGDCDNLKKVIVKDLHAWLNIKFGNYRSNPLTCARHLYSDETTEVKDLVIPEDISIIGDYAFAGCLSLVSLTIPDNVTSIGNAAFEDCSELVTVHIGNGVTSIGSQAFNNSYSLQNLTIGENVEIIGEYAFYYNTSLLYVRIPSSVSHIGSYAFGYCPNRKSYRIGSVIPPTIDGEEPFYSTEDATLYVPEASIDLYKNEKNWKYFNRIVGVLFP